MSSKINAQHHSSFNTISFATPYWVATHRFRNARPDGQKTAQLALSLQPPAKANILLDFPHLEGDKNKTKQGVLKEGCSHKPDRYISPLCDITKGALFSKAACFSRGFVRDRHCFFFPDLRITFFSIASCGSFPETLPLVLCVSGQSCHGDEPLR